MAEKQIGIQGALKLLLEACELNEQPRQLSAEVTPENPGGQLTAKRMDGTKVDRTVFLKDAMSTARAALEREQKRKRG
jgi:hypothetical protein